MQPQIATQCLSGRVVWCVAFDFSITNIFNVLTVKESANKFIHQGVLELIDSLLCFICFVTMDILSIFTLLHFFFFRVFRRIIEKKPTRLLYTFDGIDMNTEYIDYGMYFFQTAMIQSDILFSLPFVCTNCKLNQQQ